MLDAFLIEMTRSPFVDGRQDCALTVADWVVRATGAPDPARDLRGRYASPLGRERLLKRLGGLEAVMTGCAARAGLTETANPVRGDVGLIEAFGRLFAAIYLGRLWAVKSQLGLSAVSAGRVVKAWRVPHG